MQFPGVKPDEVEARVLIEKKTVINLTEAFAVAVKHYLRGEEGIDYADLYHLVKYLPSYPLPAGMPSQADLHAVPGSPTSQSDGHGLHKRKGQSTEPTPVDVTDRKGGVGGRRGSILDGRIFLPRRRLRRNYRFQLPQPLLVLDLPQITRVGQAS